MTLVKWQPNQIFRNLDKEVDQFFNQWNDTGSIDRAIAWRPKTDIKENKDSYTIEMELPGVNKKDVTISYDKNTLSIKGEKKYEKETSSDNYYRSERSYGQFSREFLLSSDVEIDSIKAEFDNGVLSVNLPKAEEKKAKEIKIN